MASRSHLRFVVWSSISCTQGSTKKTNCESSNKTKPNQRAYPARTKSVFANNNSCQFIFNPKNLYKLNKNQYKSQKHAQLQKSVINLRYHSESLCHSGRYTPGVLPILLGEAPILLGGTDTSGGGVITSVNWEEVPILHGLQGASDTLGGALDTLGAPDTPGPRTADGLRVLRFH